MAFAVLHIEKNKGGRSGLSQHISRETIPANADPVKSHLNELLIGTPNQMADIDERIKSVKQTVTLKDGSVVERGIRNDAVLAMQFILTGSHEQMLQLEKDKRLEGWKKANIKWLQETFGKENVINVTFHMDELTPHLHATVTPIVDGKLTAKTLMSSNNLRKYQTGYANIMKPFGLERGIEGSAANHTDIATYHSKVNHELPKVKEQIKELNQEISFKKGAAQIIDFVTLGTKGKIDQKEAQISTLTEQVDELHNELLKAAKANEISQNMNRQLLRQTETLKQQVRELSLEPTKAVQQFISRLNTYFRNNKIDLEVEGRGNEKDMKIYLNTPHDRNRQQGLNI